MPKDYYIVLGVSRGANLSKIKKAYRTVIKQYHPDVTQTRESTERFLEIREAYETLSNEAKRKSYDEQLAGQGSNLSVPKVPETITTRRTLFDEQEKRFSSFTDDFFEGFLPGFFDRDRGRVRSKDLYYEAILSPEEAAEGGLFPVTVPVIESCPRCSRSGFFDDFLCPVCSGYGRVTSERQFSLSIPPHVKHGTNIRLSMEDIGLRGVYLHVLVSIDSDLEGEGW
ncbi:MAG: DnaJ domain-containing protein [Deltaproteobacteria bacterium]|nr:DnaJ domain-containing protein [Deltaproteobacteria bacterium]